MHEPRSLPNHGFQIGLWNDRPAGDAVDRRRRLVDSVSMLVMQRVALRPCGPWHRRAGSGSPSLASTTEAVAPRCGTRSPSRATSSAGTAPRRAGRLGSDSGELPGPQPVADGRGDREVVGQDGLDRRGALDRPSTTGTRRGPARRRPRTRSSRGSGRTLGRSSDASVFSAMMKWSIWRSTLREWIIGSSGTFALRVRR